MAEKILNNKELEEVLLSELDVSKGKKAEVIVYNDDVNTFDWVIQCFVEVCKHNPDQAEQLSILIHFKGKASVKSGNLQELKPIKEELTARGLSAVIETFEEV